MSNAAKTVLEKFRKLPPDQQHALLQQLLQVSAPSQVLRRKAFPTIKVRGGTITSRQVAEALES